MGDTDFGVVAWDEARVLAAARAVADRGELLHTAAVLETATGDLVGFSELVLPADRSGDGQHYGTAVQPAHRRRGLALAMKAEAIRWRGPNTPGSPACAPTPPTTTPACWRSTAPWATAAPTAPSSSASRCDPAPAAAWTPPLKIRASPPGRSASSDC